MIENPWHEANQRYLISELSKVRTLLEIHANNFKGLKDGSKTEKKDCRGKNDLQDRVYDMTYSPSLERLCEIFNLSPFERNILLMCAGIELQGPFASLCAAAQGDPYRAYPTFSLALAAFPDAHWSALLPTAPLRWWRLIEIERGKSLTTSPLHIDESILHYLAGIEFIDERLKGIFEPVHTLSGLVPSHADVSSHMAKKWSNIRDVEPLPVFQLCGKDMMDKRAIAADACTKLALKLYTVSAYSLPVAPEELNVLVRLWDRNAVLNNSALLLECSNLDTFDMVHLNALKQFIRLSGCPMIINSSEPIHILGPLVTFYMHRPYPTEQDMLWRLLLGEQAGQLNGQIERIVSQFSLSASAIYAAGIEALGTLNTDEANSADPLVNKGDNLDNILWKTCLQQARPQLEDLAQHIDPVATWDDIVLKEPQKQTLREIAAHVRQRFTVYETWGFRSKSTRGLGISALFAGTSGTGKTMAAEVLANELHLDLYRIDLSQMVSKYIGETEKNLHRVFDAAENGGVILLFDEADALFGKRSEVRDSHDRYANIEISYLLQRMETYRGLAILTTNMANSLDSAFLRRIRFIIQFPFPDFSQRSEIWTRIFPDNTPKENIDVCKLARLNITGGNIRNIAMNAAFLASDAGEPVRMTHLLHATRSEYLKMEKPLSATQIKDWP